MSAGPATHLMHRFAWTNDYCGRIRKTVITRLINRMEGRIHSHACNYEHSARGACGVPDARTTEGLTVQGKRREDGYGNTTVSS